MYASGDDRISLRENIGGWLNDFVQEDQDSWYLCGDTLFLNAIEGDFHSQSKECEYPKLFWILAFGTFSGSWWLNAVKPSMPSYTYKAGQKLLKYADID